MLRKKVFGMTHSTVLESTQFSHVWLTTRASNKRQFTPFRCLYVSVIFVNIPVDLKYIVWALKH